MRTVTLEAYTKLERPKISWLIPNLIPKPGLIILLGAPKVGKSFFALQLGLCLAQQTPFLDMDIDKKHRVLYIQLDTSELIWRDRLNKVSDGGQSIEGEVYLIHPEDLDMPCLITRESVKLKLKKVLEDLDPDLVVIDVLRELHQHSENDSTEMKIVGDCIMEVFGAYAVMILHHSRKAYTEPGQQVDPMMMSRGSSYITGKADAIWYLDKHQLIMESRFDTIRRYSIQQDAIGFIAADGKVPHYGIDAKQTRVLAFVKDAQLADPTRSVLEIYLQNLSLFETMNVSRATYYRYLKAAKVYDPLASSSLDSE